MSKNSNHFEKGRHPSEGQGNDFEKVADEAYLTTQEVLDYVGGRAQEVPDKDVREDVEGQLKEWGVGTNELLGLFLMKLAETENLREAKEKAAARKEVLFQNEQLPILAVLTSKFGPEKASARFQRVLKDLGVDHDVVFRGILKEEK